MRYRNIAITTAAAGLVAALGFAAPAQADLTTYCDGVASDVTVPGDLVVDAGNSCELTNVTVSGNATVEEDANLLLDGSAVEGDLEVNDNGFVDAIDTSVTGATSLAAAYGAYAEGTSLDGSVDVMDAGFFYSVDSTHGDSVTSANGETFLENGWVTSDLSTDGDVLTDVYDTVVEGDVAVSGSEQGSVFCLSEVDGDASFSGNSDILQVGASAPLSGCGFNVFGGNLSITDNTAEAQVTDNVVRGDLTCSGNDPLPVVADNRVRGTEDCESAEANAVSSQRVTGASEDRKDAVKADIDARTDAGTAAAEDAGHAFK